MSDGDVAADGIVHVNGLGLPGLPRPGHECVGFGSQGADGAEVDDVAGQLSHQHLLNVRANLRSRVEEINNRLLRTEMNGHKSVFRTDCTHLHLISSASCAQIFAAGHLGGESDAASAVDAAGHDGLDQRAEVLVLHGTLATQVVVGEA